MSSDMTHCSRRPANAVWIPPAKDACPSRPLATAWQMKIGLRQEMREAAPISIVPATSPPSRTACRMEYLPVTPAPVRWHKKNTWKLGAPRSRPRETIRVGSPRLELHRHGEAEHGAVRFVRRR